MAADSQTLAALAVVQQQFVTTRGLTVAALEVRVANQQERINDLEGVVVDVDGRARILEEEAHSMRRRQRTDQEQIILLSNGIDRADRAFRCILRLLDEADGSEPLVRSIRRALWDNGVGTEAVAAARPRYVRHRAR